MKTWASEGFMKNKKALFLHDPGGHKKEQMPSSGCKSLSGLFWAMVSHTCNPCTVEATRRLPHVPGQPGPQRLSLQKSLSGFSTR